MKKIMVLLGVIVMIYFLTVSKAHAYPVHRFSEVPGGITT